MRTAISPKVETRHPPGDLASWYLLHQSQTFCHFMHIILWLAVLLVLTLKARQGGYDAQEHPGIKPGAFTLAPS
jgi:hypothetical protein